MEKFIISQEGLDKIKAELEYLKTTERTNVAEELKTAREFGDLSENAEYDAAKDKRDKVESMIQDLENKIANAVITEDAKDSRTVRIGNTVKIQKMGTSDSPISTFKIVGSIEAASADLSKNWISNDSPVGKALMGCKRNQEVTVKTPRGLVKYKILEISL